jgi:hypothetical protein
MNWKTIDYLRDYQKWRRGADDMEAPDPTELGDHLDLAIKGLTTCVTYAEMLNRISTMVMEFCQDEDTTELGVARLKAKYYALKVEEAWKTVDRLEESQEEEAE